MRALLAHPRDILPKSYLAKLEAKLVKGRKFQVKSVKGSHTQRGGRNAKLEFTRVIHAVADQLISSVASQNNPTVGV